MSLPVTLQQMERSSEQQRRLLLIRREKTKRAWVSMVFKFYFKLSGPRQPLVHAAGCLPTSPSVT